MTLGSISTTRTWGEIKDDLEQCSGVDYYLWRPSDWDSILGVLQ